MSSNIYQAPFYVPPKVSTPFNGTCLPGQIILFKHNSWDSPSTIIDTNSSEYPANHFFSFSGNSIQDNTTFIVFNLPPNIVCTLCNHIVKNSNHYDFSGAGTCVDLIGNGQIQTIDMWQYGANDVLSGGIWRKVDPSKGWFQLFKHTDQRGTFATIFLDEWPSSEPNSIAKWWLQDESSSINYPCLTPPQLLKLFDHSNGSGHQKVLGASNALGEYDKKAVVNLTESGTTDKVSSFSYSLIPPTDAVIDNIEIDISESIQPSGSITDKISGINDSSQAIPITKTVATDESTSITNTTTLQIETGVSVEASISTTVAVGDFVSFNSTLSLSFNVTIGASSTLSTTTTNTHSLENQVQFTVSPHSKYSCEWMIAIGQFPKTEITHTGHFYYEQKLPGSILQESGPYAGKYMLDLPITVVIEGSVGSDIKFEIHEEPLE